MALLRYLIWVPILLQKECLSQSSQSTTTESPCLAAWCPASGEEPTPGGDIAENYPPGPSQSEALFDEGGGGEINEDQITMLPEDINPNTTCFNNGQCVTESDMILTPEQMQMFNNNSDGGILPADVNNGTERKGLMDSTFRWPDDVNGVPTVSYVFYISKSYQAPIKAGLRHWMDHTCLVFKEINTTELDQSHLQFFPGSGCWSYVGQIWYWYGQPVSIGSGCHYLGVVVHEVGHALGLWHEQSSSSRGEHVVVNLENVIPGLEVNFGTVADDNFGVEYDYASDMHYGGRYFTHHGNITIATLDPLQQELLASRLGLTHRDKLIANRMYNCTGKWLDNCNISEDPCLNEGYIGKDCVCVCPVHTSGTNCETVNGDYYEHLRSSKTEKITEEKNITVEFYAEKFTKYIVAPVCMRPVVTFTKFHLYQMSEATYSTYCYFEFLNIRNGSDLYDGEIFCDEQIKPGDVFTSPTRELILYTESAHWAFHSIWSARVTFSNVSDCDASSTTPPSSSPSQTNNPSDTSTQNSDQQNQQNLDQKQQPNINQQESSSECTSSVPKHGGGTPLIRAAAEGYIDIVKTLLINGADVDTALPDGSTALSVAAANGYEKIVELLLQYGANANIYKGSCNVGTSHNKAYTTGSPNN